VLAQHVRDPGFNFQEKKTTTKNPTIFSIYNVFIGMQSYHKLRGTIFDRGRVSYLEEKIRQVS
jgi:hypothetical protein